VVRPLVVVDHPEDWPLDFGGVELVAARHYLTEPRFVELRGAKVFNLCRSYRYQSSGYYVSLLAEARGHKPLPSNTTIQDIKQQAIVRVASDDLDDLIQKSLASIRSKAFVLSVYFGRNLAKRHDELAQALFKLFPSPFLRFQLVFSNRQDKWILTQVAPLAASEIPDEHRDFAIEVSRAFFAGRRRVGRRRAPARYDLAILYDPKENLPPSNLGAVQRFTHAGEQVGFAVEVISKADYGRLAEFDALFIRETTAVNHHTYRFARRAVAEGLVVIDDPESILKCTNKVFLAELLARAKLPTPRTVVVHRGNARDVTKDLELPCILKQPDSSFSQGVVKVETPIDLKAALDRLFTHSDLLIAQEFMPTAFDWRVGMLGRAPLFVCRYFMASHHWQIVRHSGDGECEVGEAETLPVEQAPTEVLRLAKRAADLIGDGFYGVDIKQVGKKLYVIEINDNPSVDATGEDEVLGDELYLRVMRTLLARVEARKQGGGLS